MTSAQRAARRAKIAKRAAQLRRYHDIVSYSGGRRLPLFKGVMQNDDEFSEEYEALTGGEP